MSKSAQRSAMSNSGEIHQALSTDETAPANSLSVRAESLRGVRAGAQQDVRSIAGRAPDPSGSSPSNSSQADPGNPAIVPLTPATLDRWRSAINVDCHGQGITDCKSLMKIFTRTLQEAEEVEDGWSDWMEDQILDSLHERARVNRFRQIGAKCDSGGCVFFIGSKSAAEMFGGPRNHDDFTKWLGTKPWNEELQHNTKLNGDSSTLAWEVYGLATEPFFVWYIVTKKG
jgi:hypothetical protein